ncbi:hypothetical protein GCM10027589_43690 [Actinocorallia lasiicapitis]
MPSSRRLLGLTAALTSLCLLSAACSGGEPGAVFTPTPEASVPKSAGKPSGKAEDRGKVVALPAPEAMPAPGLQPKGTGGGTRGKKDGGKQKTPPSIPKTGSCMKGVGTWDITKKALTGSGSCWYYTWSPNDWYGAPPGVEFVPMIWSAKDIGQVGQVQGRTLLGFNEPDMAGQANMSVEQALDLWPQLEKTGKRLGSPAPVWGGDIPGRWLDQFMRGAEQRGYRVDFIALHFYTKNFDTATAVSELKGYLERTYARYRKPIWLTEFALINHEGGMFYPPLWQQAAFVKSATSMLAKLPYLERYAWYALPNTRNNPTGLMDGDGNPTEPGRAFIDAARTK